MNHKLMAKKVLSSIRRDGVKVTAKRIISRVKGYNKLNVPRIKKWKSSGMSSDFDVSVIIPTYNRSDLLVELISRWEKVQSYTDLSFEIIISDDGSNDNSLEILSKPNRIHNFTIINNEHKGPANARNKAIHKARGHILVIVGDDIYPEPNFIDLHFNRHKELSDTDALLGNCEWYKGLKPNFLMKHITELGCEQFSFIHFEPQTYTDYRHFYTCNISLKREFVLSESKTFDDDFYKVNFEDIEFGYRLSKKGMKIYYDDSIVAEHNHLYDSLVKFFNRQKTAGEMANVFYQKHPECDWFLSTETTKLVWSNVLSDVELTTERKKTPLLDELISFMQRLEDDSLLLDTIYEKNARDIYSALFRFGYELGVNFDYPALDTDRVLVDRFLTPDLLLNIKILSEDFGYIQSYTRIVEMMASYQEPFTKLHIICDEDLERKYRHNLVSDDLVTYHQNEENVKGYIYKPENDFVLDTNAIKNISLYINSISKAQAILMSFGLVKEDQVGIFDVIENNKIEYIYDQGKKNGLNEYVKVNIHSQENTTFIDFADVKEKNIKFKKLPCIGRLISKPKSSIPKEDGRSVVFVLPTFLAVGGAETNLLQVINELKYKYRFVILNTEKLNYSLGSLHKQFSQCCESIYDLSELYTYDDYILALNYLKTIYDPKCVLITNGSPWLARSIGEVRQVFHNTAIIDHQVYDSVNGWVSLYYDYHNSKIKEFDRFVAINTKIQEVFVNSAQVSSEKVDMIYHIVDTERFSNQGFDAKLARNKFSLPDGKKIITFVGRMNEQKRPELLIKLIKKINEIRDDLHFVIVGDGPLSGMVDKKLNQEKIGNVTRIFYLREVEELYSTSDAFIMTSQFEGLPIAMLEAMCMAVPVFAPNVGDIDVIIEQYKNGFVYSKDDHVSIIANHLNIFLDELDEHRITSSNVSTSIRERFSRKNISVQYDKCLKSAMEDKYLD
ncbi:glycosyltransferase [Vibrio splendidus]|nr:glycosyltransferase [Vibrio splendidus]